MGGCCCCASGGTESVAEPANIYDGDGHELLASVTHETVSAPPAASLQTLPRDVERRQKKAGDPPLAGSQQTGEVHTNRSTGISDSNDKTEFEYNSDKIKEDEIQSTNPSPTNEEDGCPICLEEYDSSNPPISTKCEHRYHLHCIIEWMERSETCPICDQAIEDIPLKAA